MPLFFLVAEKNCAGSASHQVKQIFSTEKRSYFASKNGSRLTDFAFKAWHDIMPAGYALRVSSYPDRQKKVPSPTRDGA
jgi:hypothetical protein